VSRRNGHRTPSRGGVLVVEPSDVLAAGLEQVLRGNGVDVVAIARDDEQAIRLVDSTRPAVVLIDLDPAGAGLRLGIEIMRTDPGTKVAALAHGHEAEAVRGARQAGFHGHVSLRASGFEIARSIERIRRGQPRVLAHLGPSSEPQPAGEGWFLSSQLTDREREVLRLLAVGLSNDRIAELLFLSPHTVRTHVQNIRTKLGVRSRLEAAVFAIRSGLAELSAEARSA
jgi:DNA-binding NarL/FixJ family response regulator